MSGAYSFDRNPLRLWPATVNVTYAYNQVSDEQLVLALPVRASSTCWDSILTQEEKDKLIFMGKCGQCKAVHECSKCDKCKTTRMQSGKCQSCCYIKPKEDYYSSYCGNCFQLHELPNCVECQHYRLKPGRCTIVEQLAQMTSSGRILVWMKMKTMTD